MNVSYLNIAILVECTIEGGECSELRFLFVLYLFWFIQFSCPVLHYIYLVIIYLFLIFFSENSGSEDDDDQLNIKLNG